jgi:protein-S-isoprenylcysteine O-methyltransferase Ste14
MNTPKQLLRENAGHFTVSGRVISPAWHETPERAPASDRRTKYRRIAGVILGLIAVSAYPLHQELVRLPLQEFEGLGGVACVLAGAGFYLWQMHRALTKDSEQAETSNHTATLPAGPGASPEEHPTLRT